MNTQTKTVLAALGLVSVIGALVVVARLPSGDGCKEIAVTCEFFAGDTYSRRTERGLACMTDAGAIELALERTDAGVFDISRCEIAPVKAGAAYPQNSDFECAWNPSGGFCEKLEVTGFGVESDGGENWVTAGIVETIGPGRWRGPDCKRRPCAEVAGFPWKK